MIDLVIEIEREHGSVIEELKIVTRIESDHLPVSLECAGTIKNKQEEREGEGREREGRLRWVESRREKYIAGMTEKINRLDGEAGNAQDRWDRLIGAIREVAGDLMGRKGNRKNTGAGKGKRQERQIRYQKNKYVEGAKKMAEIKKGGG